MGTAGKEKMGQLLTLDEIVKAAGGKAIFVKEKEFTGLSIDSRTITGGELFVALKGPHFDGHAFLSDALRKCAGAVVKTLPAEIPEDKTVICVADTLTALQDIAHHRLQKSGMPVIGITGTNGKTTTKELLASILGQSRRVLKTRGNLNNHIGLPLSVAGMRGDEAIAVLEMGSNAEGDIDLLCRIAGPDYAVVTNVGPAHLEGFGSLEAVRKTDLEILNYVKTVTVNADDRFLMEGLEGYAGKVLTFGMEFPADVSAKEVRPGERGSSFILVLPGGVEMPVNLGLSGAFNLLNALGAAAVASEMGVAPGEIRKGLESFTGVPMRLEIKSFLGALVISDVYNANPASMKEALKELVRLRKKRAIAVLGDMLELGSFSEEAHRELGRMLSEAGVDVFIAVGREMARACEEFTGACFRSDDAEEAGTILTGICREGDTVLVKGSRGMRMENVLTAEDATTRGDRHAL